MPYGLITTLLATSLYTAMASAGKLEIVGPCLETPLFSASIQGVDGKSAGAVTVETLTSENIPFAGTERGMNSIFNTPTGLEAVEVLSDSEMLAYGWCYSVNGVEPAKYADQAILKEDDTLKWWFGYARYKDGVWVSQCRPSHVRKPVQFCGNN